MIKKVQQSLSIWLIKKIQKHGPHRVEVLGRTYEISEDVFNPRYYYTSSFMAKHIRVASSDKVLDMGTGSGIQAVTAGSAAAEVIAVDINPEAVRFARENARRNGVDNIVTVMEGDLFSPLNPGSIFDVILFTPPYLEGTPEKQFDHALFDSGKALLRRFFMEARAHIKPDGYVQMIYSSIADPVEALSIAAQSGWVHSIIARERTFTEEFFIYRLTLHKQ